MKLMAAGIAIALLLAGCVGSGSSSDGAPPTNSNFLPKKVALVDACPQAQVALDAAFDGKIMGGKPEQYVSFATAMSAITDKMDPADAQPLAKMSAAASRVNAKTLTGTSKEMFNALAEWVHQVRVAGNACVKAGADPLYRR